MKLSSFRYLVGQGFDNVWKNRVMAFASFCVLLVSLLLVGFSLLFTININLVIGGIENKNEVRIVLEDGTGKQRRDEIEQALQNMDNVSEVTFVSREEAFENLKDQMQEDAPLFDALGNDNPLPDVFNIRVSDISGMDETVLAVKQMENIESIDSPDDFVELLTELRRIVSIVSLAVIIAMLIVSMVIISNTTRASVFSRRREISIMQSVGATNSFIRFPFFVEGMINGFMAGVFATFITWLSYDALIGIIENFDYLSSFGLDNIVRYDDIAIPVMLSYIIFGSFIGAIGSVMSTRVHLKYRAANM